MKNIKRERHGYTKECSAEYRAWTSMRARCLNPKDKRYPRYGGRGITICDRWMESFLNFLEDMGPRPSSKHSLDREDNDGNYEPGNCRWATREEQNKNCRSNRRCTFRGKTQCLSEWAAELGIKYRTLHARLEAGKSIEEAFTRADLRKVS